ncbi:GDSL family lipase [Lampropedia puyangensis]|uniref:GDSL family lipase n=1 Tax=Lampropedia puyangensis TaxID=1330072 RepID=A0A4V4GSC7_9BURK|nr:SGNH/GDSL hydrolase family protein [Lampropedia puyangensis]THU05156.1 GDSL family lipase [Lampropedia puyangensis]
MAFQWSRCAGYLAAAITAASLAACGSSSVESAFNASRVIAFGDGQSDVGQSGSRFTVNGVTERSNWTEEVASNYGLTVTPASQGGTSYAWGNTRVLATPDAAGNANTPTLRDQIGSFLASNSFNGGDLVLVSGGTSDVIAVAQQALSGAITREQAYTDVRRISGELTSQVQRLRENGAQYIVVIGTYNLSKSIWARNIGEQAFLEGLSKTFNEGFKISMEETTYKPNVLYVDLEQYVNVVSNGPNYYAINNMDQPVCNSVDSAAGIGIGAGHVSSALCNLSTVVSSSVDQYGFADEVYLTPTVQRQFGSWAAGLIRDRW